MGICAKSNQALQAALGIRTTCPTLAAPLSRSWWERVIFSVPQREPAAGPGRLGESETPVYSEPEKSMHSLLKAREARCSDSADRRRRERDDRRRGSEARQHLVARRTDET